MTTRQPLSNKLAAICAIVLLAFSAFAMASCGPQEQTASQSSATSSSSASASSSPAVKKIDVPDVTSLTLKDAKEIIAKTGFKTGNVTEKTSDDLDEGTIVSQDPAANTKAEAGSKINLVVSTGVEKASVPNVVPYTIEDAKKAITDAGFKVGNIAKKSSENVIENRVISQDPEASTEAAKGTEIDLIVSSGKESPKKTRVPDVVSLSLDSAIETLEKAGLEAGTVTKKPSDSVAENIVISQDPAASKEVPQGSKVSLVVSSGKPAQTTAEVPNLHGLDQASAEAALKNVGLGFDGTSAYSDDYPKGTVIDQSIPAGTEVARGTVVVASVSAGPEPATTAEVPDLTGLSWADAQSVLEAVGFKAAFTGDRNGYVTQQDAKAGSELRLGARVTVTLKKEEQKVAVPDLVGMSPTAAYDLCDQLGLEFKISKGGEHGEIVSQSPKAGKEVKEGSTVTVKVDDSEFR